MPDIDLTKVTLLVDGNHLLNRIVHVANYANMYSGPAGTYTGGLVGVLDSLRRIVDKVRPSRCYVVWDGGHSQRRKSISPEYKLRIKDKEISQKVSLSKGILDEVFKHIGVHSLLISGREADDIIAALANMSLFKFLDSVHIVTGDEDFLQCVRPGVSIYQPNKDRYVTWENFVSVVGVTPENFLLFKSIIGDSSDNIPGVKGVGSGSASGIINKMNGASLKEKLSSLDGQSKRETLVSEAYDVISKNLDLIDMRKENFSEEDIAKMKEFLSRNSVFSLDNLRSYLAQYGINKIGMFNLETWSGAFDVMSRSDV